MSISSFGKMIVRLSRRFSTAFFRLVCSVQFICSMKPGSFMSCSTCAWMNASRYCFNSFQSYRFGCVMVRYSTMMVGNKPNNQSSVSVNVIVNIVFIVCIIAWFSLMRNLLFPGQNGTTNSSASSAAISSSILMISQRRLVHGQFHSACMASCNRLLSLARLSSNQRCQSARVLICFAGSVIVIDFAC